MATASNVEITCPLCERAIRIPLTLKLNPATTSGGSGHVTVSTKTVRHTCRR